LLKHHNSALSCQIALQFGR